MTQECGWSALTTLLCRRDAILDDVLAARDLAAHWRRLAILMTVCAATYGAVLGQWHGIRLALYDAVKFPLVLLLTSALTVGFHWIAAAVLGLPLRFRQVAVLSFLGLTAGGVLLASLAPVAWLFTVSAPAPSSAARTAHNLLYLMHTAFVAVSGAAGTTVLRAALQRVARSEPAARNVYALGAELCPGRWRGRVGLPPLRRQCVLPDHVPAQGCAARQRLRIHRDEHRAALPLTPHGLRRVRP